MEARLVIWAIRRSGHELSLIVLFLRGGKWGLTTLKNQDGLSEYVSRKTRVNLVNLLIDEFGSRRKVGEELGVSHVAVISWLDPEETHPSNATLKKIIDLAFESRRNETLSELRKDLDRHSSLFKKIKDSWQ